ncbi:hypothetical protein [Geomonas sp.]|uniref:hypothetical protein n=1 Tax=Geomonas sp. TaxID=2651584 RepID=UPI002B49EFB9|nr:hypothetical protein [Geomonas sp.]HJV36332.1 hypothetical protein [Geomonas sp.]
MSKKSYQRGASRVQTNIGRQGGAGQGGSQPVSLQQGKVVDMTPGRAPAEGGEIDSPSHERWEERTPDRDPAEGADMEEK